MQAEPRGAPDGPQASLTVSRSCARGGGSSPGATARRSASRSRPIPSIRASSAWRFSASALASFKAAREGFAAQPRRLRRLRLGLRELVELAAELVEVAVERADAALDRLEPLVEPVDRVLDSLEPLRDGAQAARQTLDVGGRRDPQSAHRGLLGLQSLLARLERTRQRARDHRVAGQLFRDLAEGLLALLGEALTQPWVLAFFAHGGSSLLQRLGGAASVLWCVDLKSTLKLNSTLMFVYARV